MNLLLEFIAQQWMLTSALAVLLVLLAMHESRKGAKSVTPQELSNLVNKKDGVLIDLRDKAEYNAGHIVDSIHISAAQFASHLSELGKYKNRPVVLICKFGQHAGSVSKQMKAAGFEEVYKLGGGIAEWQNSQLPLVKK
jgi:rhodanese-related sulfurtransferase